ncbi:MAG: IS110 family transposase, partial [Verrucomicrobia bacterium]|nr:IS110 family transposase [Verrucomicrobiota bacterium]
FTLRQSLAAWRFHHQLADECLQEIHRLAAKLESRTEAAAPSPTKRGRQPDAVTRTLLFQKLGVDLTAVDGVNLHVGFTFLTEVGPDLSRFASPENFASWLGLCPINKVSGKRKLSVSTRPVSDRLATALRMAAQSLNRVESPLGDWFRRMRAKLGPVGAVTAAAHKVARILYAMIKYRKPFDPARLGNPVLRQARKENAIRRAAKELGYTLQPIQAVAVS